MKSSPNIETSGLKACARSDWKFQLSYSASDVTELNLDFQFIE